jgi:SOS-response transcriptional repressor LexA
MDITPIQKKTLDFIQTFYMANGFPPSIQEIASDSEVACNAIQGRVESLERNMFLTKKKRVARSIVLTEKGKQAIV